MGLMTLKHGRISSLTEPFHGRAKDAHYLAYFDCFNRQLYFEAHEVLEVLWLRERGGVNGDYYKGLIQLAGAFVLLQKNRSAPAAALFRLAEKNLRKYPARHEQLSLETVLDLAESWRRRLETPPGDTNLLACHPAPRLELENGG